MYSVHAHIHTHPLDHVHQYQALANIYDITYVDCNQPDSVRTTPVLPPTEGSRPAGEGKVIYHVCRLFRVL